MVVIELPQVRSERLAGTSDRLVVSPEWLGNAAKFMFGGSIWQPLAPAISAGPWNNSNCTTSSERFAAKEAFRRDVTR